MHSWTDWLVFVIGGILIGAWLVLEFLIWLDRNNVDFEHKSLAQNFAIIDRQIAKCIDSEADLQQLQTRVARNRRRRFWRR